MIFHPYEIGFAGYSNTGKTRLITRLIEHLKESYEIGDIKHASCGFSLDVPGKDSALVYQSGAKEIHLTDSTHHASIKRGDYSSLFDTLPLLKNDFLFVEGYKELSHEKILFVDNDKKLLRLNNIIATVGNGGTFSRNDTFPIAQFILSRFLEKANEIPLYGLLLAGGKSERMGRDKALIEYHKNTTQAQRGYELLSPLCDKVFLSRRQEQKPIDLPTLFDTFENIGPMGGILTAMQRHSKAAWLVLACDYPFMDFSSLETLIKQRNPFKFATAYAAKDHLVEPLCTIYEPKSFSLLLQALSQGEHCPRKILINSPIQLLSPPSPKALSNVNSPLSQEFIEQLGT